MLRSSLSCVTANNVFPIHIQGTAQVPSLFPVYSPPFNSLWDQFRERGVWFKTKNHFERFFKILEVISPP